jgi:predicted Zn-dependent protease
MRGADLVPLALVGALAGVVGFAFVRQPHVVQPKPVLGPDPSTVATIAIDIVDSAPTHPQTGARPGGAPASRLPYASDPILEEISRRMQYGAAGTYIREAYEGRTFVARWPDGRADPLRIWVQPFAKLRDWNSANPAAARDGIGRWSDAGIPVRMIFVVDSSEADVIVVWADTLPGRIGQAQRSINRKYHYVRAEITIALHHSIDPTPFGTEMIRATAAHEAGHMLGLDHSPYQDDIMHSGLNRQIDPSGRDLLTMRLLYTLPPGRFR